MKQLDFSKNTIQGTVWGGINKFVAVFMPFIVRTILIRRLGAEYAGLSSLFTSILQVLSLAELGFASAMVYEMYKPIAENNIDEISALLKFYKKIYIIIGCAVVIIGMCIMPILGVLIKGEVPSDVNIYILYVIYLLNTAISYFLFAYRASIMSAYQREADNAKIQLVTNTLMYLVQITVLLLFANYYVYIVFLPVFTLIYNFARYAYVKKKYPQIKCEGEITESQKKGIKKNISALFLHKVGNVTVNTLDNIVVSSFLGLVLLSNYNNYFYLINAITSIILIFFNSITAGVGNRLIVKDNESNVGDFYKIFYINGFSVVVCTTCLFAVFQEFITIWVGKEYLFQPITMILFCIYFFVHTIRRTIIAYRDAAGMWVDNKWQPIVSAIVNLTLNISLVRIIGVNGVVISTIISMLIVDIPWETGKLIHKLFNQRTTGYYLRLIEYGVIAFACCGTIYWFFSKITINYTVISLMIKGMSAFVFSSVVFGIATFRTGEFQYISRYLKGKIRNYRKKP